MGTRDRTFTTTFGAIRRIKRFTSVALIGAAVALTSCSKDPVEPAAGPEADFAWTRQQAPTTERLVAVWGPSGNEVFAVGTGGTILQSDGTTWSPMVTADSSVFPMGAPPT